MRGMVNVIGSILDKVGDAMPLTDAEVKALKPKEKVFTVQDGRGLYLEVSPVGGKSWRVRYQFNGKTEKLTLGKYPDLTIKDARLLRDEALNSAAKGVSPTKQKRTAKALLADSMTVRQFRDVFMKDVQEKDRKDNKQVIRYFENDIEPFIGATLLKDVTTEDVRSTIWRKKDQGHDAAAHQVRTLLKKIFDYAVTKGLMPFNPVYSLPARHVFRPTSRDRYLTPAEVEVFLRSAYNSNIRRQFKLQLHLSLILMIRKGELSNAEWKDVDLDNGEFLITQESSKTGAQIVIKLPRQAIEMFEELKRLAGGSRFVIPSRSSLDKPFAHNSINNALKMAMKGQDIPAFVPHDLRRTAATLLSENGWDSDVVDKALNHKMKGTRATYIRSELIEQRKEMLQFWADYLDSLLNRNNVILGRFATA